MIKRLPIYILVIFSLSFSGFVFAQDEEEQLPDPNVQVQPATPAAVTSLSVGSGLGKSNAVCVRVGNPLEPEPAVCRAATAGLRPGTPLSGGPLGFRVSCPLGNDFKITNGTAVFPVDGHGHGAPGYQPCKSPPYASCPGGQHSEALRKSIDVVIGSTGNASGVLVYYPYINGNQVVEWRKVSGPTPIAGGAWGYKAEYVTNFQGKELKLDLTHINNNVSPAGRSGEEITRTYPSTDGAGRGHLHTLLYVDGRPVETAEEAYICK